MDKVVVITGASGGIGAELAKQLAARGAKVVVAARRKDELDAVAREIGAPKAVRAVAQACGANPVALAVPCHRVIRTDGALCGYRWGVERKRVLLEREKVGKSETRNRR